MRMKEQIEGADEDDMCNEKKTEMPKQEKPNKQEAVSIGCDEGAPRGRSSSRSRLLQTRISCPSSPT
jgi:hypothetical protein